MNRTTLLIVAALATAAILVPTGAAPFNLTGTDSVGDDIVLRPADGANGNYALLNERDEIELLLTGANPAIEGDGVGSDTVTPIPRVFTMTYTGDRSAMVWLTDDADDVRFYRGGDSADSVEGRDNSVTLGPSQTVTVGLLVDTRGEHDVEQAETFSVNAEIARSDDASVDSDDRGDRNRNNRDGPTPTRLTPDDDDNGGRDAPPPTSTAQPTVQGSADGPPTDGDESDAEGAPGTPAPTQSQTAAVTDDGGRAPAELGGGGLGPLLAIGGGLAILAALAGYRQFG